VEGRSRLLKLLRFIYHLPNFLKLAWRLYWDPRVPVHVKFIPMLFGAMAIVFLAFYYVMPIDFWPDFLPLGKLDDPFVPILLIFLPGIWLFVKACPREIVLEHAEMIDEERRGRWIWRG